LRPSFSTLCSCPRVACDAKTDSFRGWPASGRAVSASGARAGSTTCTPSNARSLSCRRSGGVEQVGGVFERKQVPYPRTPPYLATAMKQAKYPDGWDEARVKRVLAHYEQQSDEEAVAEDEARVDDAHGDGSSRRARAGCSRAVGQASRRATSSRASSLGENGPIEVPAARVAPIIGEAVKRRSDRQARPRRAFRVSCRGSVHVTGSAGRSAISRFISAELSDLPWASSASDRVTPPSSARAMTKFSAPSCGSS
jgi:hypothetical protein